jgi:hypothetical protein
MEIEIDGAFSIVDIEACISISGPSKDVGRWSDFVDSERFGAMERMEEFVDLNDLACSEVLRPAIPNLRALRVCPE